MHSALAMSRLESLDKVDEICQTCIDTLNAAQLRYQEYMTTGQCDQLIQQVLVYVDQIKQRDQSEDVLPPITASPPTNTPEPAITASPPTNTPEPAITASPPTNTPEPAITASPPTNTPEPAITASPPTNTPEPAITASPPTNTPEPAITASPPTNTPEPAITASPPTNTPEPAITASPPTNTPEPAITASPPTNTPGPAITASQPTNTPEPAITASPPTNTPGPAITASPPTNTPEPAITTGQSIDHQGTPSMTDQPKHLVDFIQIVPSEYEKNVVELTGIPVDLRTEFMKKYFQEINRVMGSKESGQELVDKDRRSVCRRLKLPPLEVLGAFLTLKTTSERGTILEQYSIAHKGLQENYAALHILKTFQKDPQNTIIATMENTLGVKIEKNQFYLNMFKHLAGLLDLEISNPSEGLIWEIVELIEKAGESSQNAWLDILEEVKLSEVFIKAVARCCPIQDGIVVKETRAAVYSILLPHLCPAQVIVDIRSDPTPLLPAVTNHTFRSCTRVELWHHWYHPNNSTSQLRNLLSGDSLRVFRGHGTVELDRLPASLKELMIAISEDNQARSMLPLLMTQQMHLQHIEVHVTTKVSTEAITNPLPDVTTVFKKPGVSLFLSNVKEGEEGWVCEVAAKLQPLQG
ncbi:hypothetical protein Pmani_024086 [Petrolisthes manimaculis]|uniref:Uncharacterized protein n=1 Tax=Petrolisthes manimaculis TaxID=1843537 RepID=A0AAE1P8Y0_9EUCA|nr:hypothetical protein Pmani_024086 [Petrolisthes manimaculis]